MKKLLFLTFVLFGATNICAVEVEIDGLWYDVVNKIKEAKVIQFKDNNKYKGDIDIPETIIIDDVTYHVTGIGYGAFSSCYALTSITIPNSVTYIDKYAFYNCYGLRSVKIGNSVTSIGESAFSNLNWLTSITIPNSVTSIEWGAFSGCGNLESIHISDLTSWCKIVFGSAPLYWAKHLFLNGEEIKDLVIPNSITSIGEYTFSGCTGLTSVTIPNSVTNIEAHAFSQCTGLTSVTIPNSVTKIGGYAFYGCIGLTSVTIPNSVTNIEAFAFEKCTGLTSIEIPNSVTKIGEYAFNSCKSVKYITIGNRVVIIYEKAFADCPDLTDVYCYAENVPNIKPNKNDSRIDAFDGSLIEYATLHVPESALNTYKSTEPWSNFGKIVAIPEYVLGDVNNDGTVDISDYIGVANHILGNTPEGFNEKAADVNEDNVIDISDYIGVANIILTGKP